MNIKLRARIAIMATLLLIPLVAQAIIVLNSNTEAHNLAEKIGERADPATRLLLNVDRDAYQAQLALERLEVSSSEDIRDANLESLRENLQQTGERFAEFERLALGLEGEEKVIREFRVYHQQWSQGIDETIVALAIADDAHDALAADVVAGVENVDTSEASATRAVADRELAATRDSFAIMRERLDILEEEFYEVEAAALIGDLNSGVAATTSAVWLTLIVGMFIGTAAALLIGRWIARMVTGSTRTLDAVSVTVEGAAGELGEVVQTTVGTVGTVAGMADEVSTKINETMHAVDAFSDSIDEIANKADRASVVAQDAARLTKSTNQSVAKLADSSEEIGQVIEVITSIAKQTNLLALNATIEAARAGEAGRGFGVVASEVKELAQQTTDAIDQISARVGAIQQDTGESIAAIESITTVIAEIAEIQTSIASAVDQQSSTATEIVGFVDHAVTRSAEIVSSVEDISIATRTVESQVGASRSAAREVRQVATELNEMVGGQRTPVPV